MSARPASPPVLPGTQPPRRFVPRLHWELLVCGLRGHELVGTDAARLRPEDGVFAFEADERRWHRCLRCDSWLPLPPPRAPGRPEPPPREAIALPLRGRPLRDRIVLRLIAVDRALHCLVLVALGVAVLAFAAHRTQLRAGFYRIATDLQAGVGGGPVTRAHTGILHELDRLFALDSGRLHLLAAAALVYGAVEGIEAVGLWWERRWAEYLTLIVTASFLPIEVREMTIRLSWFKVTAFVVNVAVVVYLLVAKRLFGLRGGTAALQRERARDVGWPALERALPPPVAAPAPE
jgi:uncharacterized membrane protein (DUF2068 family)